MSDTDGVDVVEFYEGAYIQKKGYPFAILTTSTILDRLVSEVFIIFRAVPSGDFTMNEKEDAFSFWASRNSSAAEDAGVTDLPGMLTQHARDWIGYHLEGKRQGALTLIHTDRPIGDYVLKNSDWKKGLLKMRYAGIEGPLLERIREMTKSDTLSSYLAALLNVKPISAVSFGKKTSN